MEKQKMNKWLYIFIYFAQLTCSTFVCGEENTYLTIGTGEITGLYYLTGGAIAKIVNTKFNETGLRLSVQSTSGSVYNIENVLNGTLDLAIVQSDRLYQAYNGKLEWESKPIQQLRSVFAIHPEVVTLIASERSGITKISELKDKRVNLGHPNSGQWQNAIHALENEGLNWQEDIKFSEYEDYKIPEMIYENQLDAAIITGGHPINFFKAISYENKITFIPIDNIEPLLKKYPYYVPSTIPVSLYPNFSKMSDIQSFGVKSVLMTSEKVNDQLIYLIAKEIFSQINEFKKFHPAYSILNHKYMIDGLTAPIHPGALKYYQKMKLLKK